MTYHFAKHAHMGFAYLTITLFVVRFLLFKFQPKLKAVKLLKILPHIIDTALLGLAIYLCVLLKIYPIQTDWISAKVIALVLYIVFGVVAIRKQSTPAFIAALASFAYLLGVAKTHQIVSWFALF